MKQANSLFDDVCRLLASSWPSSSGTRWIPVPISRVYCTSEAGLAEVCAHVYIWYVCGNGGRDPKHEVATPPFVLQEILLLCVN